MRLKVKRLEKVVMIIIITEIIITLNEFKKIFTAATDVMHHRI